MGSNINAIIQEGYHLEETHLYSSYKRRGVKPIKSLQNLVLKQNLPTNHAYAIYDTIQKFLDDQDTQQMYYEKQEVIQNTLAYPYSCVGYLEFQLQGLLRRGTAFIIGKNKVLTSGSNCFSVKTNEASRNFRFYPARYKDRGESFKVSEFYFPNEYVQDKLNSQFFDMALLVLDTETDLEQSYGSLGFNFDETQFNIKSTKQMYGYQKVNHEITMHQIAGDFFIKDSLIHYQMQTHPGMNGSPIVQKINDEYYVVGIQTFSNKEVNDRGGIILTRMLFRHLLNWTSELKGEINIDGKRLGTEGVKCLVHHNWSNLKSLSLKDNCICPTAVEQLQKFDFSHIQNLDLSQNPLQAKGISRLSSFDIPHLAELNINKCQIGDYGFHALIKSHFPRLIKLSIADNYLSAQSAKSICESSFRLEYLDISNNTLILVITTSKMTDLDILLLWSGPNLSTWT